MGFVNSIIYVAIPLVPENGADSALHAEDDYEEKMQGEFWDCGGN